MSTAEVIRQFVIERYIRPARDAGRQEVHIRLGDIRQQMGLRNPLQSVRSALDTKLFEDDAGVKRVSTFSARAGADSYCHFQIVPIEASKRKRSVDEEGAGRHA